MRDKHDCADKLDALADSMHLTTNTSCAQTHALPTHCSSPYQQSKLMPHAAVDCTVREGTVFELDAPDSSVAQVWESAESSGARLAAPGGT